MMKQHWEYSVQPKSADVPASYISNTFQFWILLTFQIPSLICSLFILYKYLSDPIRRHGLHNHTILIIIIANILLILTDFSWTLDSLRRPGEILSATPAFCMVWWFLDYTLYNAQTIILAWASIERHILIFHSQMISTRKKRFYYHYLPPLILIIYLVTFYVGAIFVLPCNNEYDFASLECGSDPCYLKIPFFALWDVIVHNLLPTLTIAIFSFALLYRIIAQKKRVRQPMQWRKQRRVSIQLLSLSAVYLFLNLPFIMFFLINIVHDGKYQFGFGVQLYVFFLTYSVTLLLPFVVYFSYPSSNQQQRQRIFPIPTCLQHQRMYGRNAATIR